MGGKVLNRYGVFTERKSREEFFRIAQDIQFRVNMELNLTSATVTCYRTKADHGDLDLLIKVSFGTNVNWVDYIREAFQPQSVYANDDVYSFDYQGFQVDFIPIQESKWNSAEFGGYDYDRYLRGFDTLEDIFKFCIAGKYFDAKMFEMENLKSIDKKRNRKRWSYHLFLNYLKDNNINTSY